MTESDARRKGTWWARLVGTEAEVSAVRAEAEAIFHEQAEANAKLRAELLLARGDAEARSTAIAAAERELSALKQQRTDEARQLEVERARWSEERAQLRKKTDEELGLLYAEQRAMRAQLEDAGKRRAQLEGAAASKSASVDTLNATLDALREKHGRATRELQVAQSEVKEARAFLQQRDAELASLRASAAEATTSLEQARADASRAAAEAAAQRSTATETGQQLARSRLTLAERDAEIDRLAGLAARIPALEAQARELSSRSSALELQRKELDAQLSRQGKETARLESALLESESRRARLSEEHARSKEQLGALGAKHAADVAALEAKLRDAEERLVRAGSAARILTGLAMGGLRECVGPDLSLPLRAALRAHGPSLGPLPEAGLRAAAWLQDHFAAARIGAHVTWEDETLKVRPADEQSDGHPFDLEWAAALARALGGPR